MRRPAWHLSFTTTTYHHVHVIRQDLPHSFDALDDGLSTELPFHTDFQAHTRDFVREGVQLPHHRVDGVLEVEHLALDVDLHGLLEVSAGDGFRNVGDGSDLRGEVFGHFLHAREIEEGREWLGGELPDSARGPTHVDVVG